MRPPLARRAHRARARRSPCASPSRRTKNFGLVRRGFHPTSNKAGSRSLILSRCQPPTRPSIRGRLSMRKTVCAGLRELRGAAGVVASGARFALPISNAPRDTPAHRAGRDQRSCVRSGPPPRLEARKGRAGCRMQHALSRLDRGSLKSFHAPSRRYERIRLRELPNPARPLRERSTRAPCASSPAYGQR